MSDQLSLALERFKNGRRVKSKASGKTGTIWGTAIVSRIERGRSFPQLNVNVNWDDDREYAVASFALEVIDE